MDMDWTAVQQAALAGVIATGVIDLAGWARARWFGIIGPDWGLVGRWIVGLGGGRLVLRAQDKKTPAVPQERMLGWVFHYAVGIALALGFCGIDGFNWLIQPEPMVPTLYGLATVALPFCLMQPALGAGFAARKTPNPTLARVNSLITHGVFGFGLYAGSLFLNLFQVGL